MDDPTTCSICRTHPLDALGCPHCDHGCTRRNCPTCHEIAEGQRKAKPGRGE